MITMLLIAMSPILAMAFIVIGLTYWGELRRRKREAKAKELAAAKITVVAEAEAIVAEIYEEILAELEEL